MVIQRRFRNHNRNRLNMVKPNEIVYIDIGKEGSNLPSFCL